MRSYEIRVHVSVELSKETRVDSHCAAGHRRPGGTFCAIVSGVASKARSLLVHSTLAQRRVGLSVG